VALQAACAFNIDLVDGTGLLANFLTADSTEIVAPAEAWAVLAGGPAVIGFVAGGGHKGAFAPLSHACTAILIVVKVIEFALSSARSHPIGIIADVIV
jgi:hypothetical protein